MTLEKSSVPVVNRPGLTTLYPAAISAGGIPVFSSAVAMPSGSLTHRQATTLLVGSWSNRPTYTAFRSEMAQNTLYVHLKPTAGSPPRPKNHGSMGHP